MNKIKRFLPIFLIVLMMPSLAMADSNLGIEDRAVSYLIGDFDSGRILEEYNIDQPLDIASVSKLMTYLVVSDEIKAGHIKGDDRVTITADMEAVGGSDFRLLEGEVLTVDELLEGLMVVSGNDAAYALAVHTAGTEEAFVEMMNKKAQELKLENARFVNSHGLESPDGQNTLTTRDIFILAKHIIENYPQVLDYGQINIINMPERNYIGYSTLPLIGEMPGVDGLKTGFTEEAGYCFVATMDVNKTAYKEDYRLITIVMGTADMDERRDLSRFLLEYGTENYHMKKVLDDSMPYDQVEINSAVTKDIPIYPAKSYELLTGVNTSYTYEENIKEGLKAPLNKGEKVGEVRVFDGGEEILKEDLILKDDIEKAGLFTRITRAIGNIFSSLGSLI